MDTINTWEKLISWMSEYEPSYGWVFFNSTQNDIDNIAVVSVPMNNSITEYIDGSKDVEMVFMVQMFKLYDMEMSNTNLTAIKEVDAMSKWIEGRINRNELPDFGNNIKIRDFEILDSVPTLSVDTDNNLAQYNFQCKITYHEEVI